MRIFVQLLATSRWTLRLSGMGARRFVKIDLKLGMAGLPFNYRFSNTLVGSDCFPGSSHYCRSGGWSRPSAISSTLST